MFPPSFIIITKQYNYNKVFQTFQQKSIKMGLNMSVFDKVLIIVIISNKGIIIHILKISKAILYLIALNVILFVDRNSIIVYNKTIN